VIRSFRYQIKPTKAQERTLLTWLELTRELYNGALEDRRDRWSRFKLKTHVFDQIRQLPGVKNVRPEFAEIPSVVLRGPLDRIDKAFKNFFTRCKKGDTPGYPRFKSAKRWNTITIDDLERARVGKLFVAGGSRIAVPVLGKVKIRMHRPIEGKPKTMRIIRSCGRWYVRFACVDVQPRPLPKTGRDVGIDMGLSQFVATSDGEIFTNPRPLRAAKIGLARALRRIHRRKCGGKRWRQAADLVGKKHAHIANVRRENHIHVANALVSRYDTVFVESLTIKGLSNGTLAKSFRDAAFGNFLRWLREKAENASRAVVEVDPRFTSQTCPQCGTVAKKSLSQRVHDCPCGLIGDRDVVAAQVILKLGRSLQGAAAPVRAQRRSAKIKSVSTTGA